MRRSIPFYFLFFAFIFSPVILKAQAAQGVPAKVGATVQGQSVQAVFTNGATDESLRLFEEAKARREATTKGPLPVTPEGPNTVLTIPGGPPPTAPLGANFAGGGPGDIEITWERDPTGVIPAGRTSTTGEPSIAQNGSNMFMTGNWYAVRSLDEGSTWTHVDPFTTFPASDGGFCCDQEAIYDPINDMYIWLLQYIQDGTDNRFRIAVSIGTTEFQNGTFWYWDIFPSGAGWPTNRWFDYPHISVSESHMTLTTNVFSTAGSFQGTTAFFFPLSDMADKGSLNWNYWTPSSGGTMTPVQGGTNKEYFGQHVNTTTLRLWRFEGGFIFSDDITHSTYGTSGHNCTGPDGTNACGRTDDRIQAGWISMGVIGFAWNAAQNSAASWPWAKVVRIRESDKTLFDERAMEFSNTGVVYPSVAVNKRGHIGGTVVLTGGDRNPEIYAWISDHYNNGSQDNYFMLSNIPRDYTFVEAGTNGPSSNRWGDYYRTRVHRPAGLNFIGTGVTLSGGGGTANSRPRNFKFGRAEDNLALGNYKGFVWAELAGPYISAGNMTTNINSILPLNQPFSGPPWNFDRQDFVFEMPDNIVDWVLLTAYNTSGAVFSRQAGLLTSSGTIQWPNGEANMTFPGTLLGIPAHLGLDHRNHLEVVTAQKTTNFDHSFRLSGAFGINSQRSSGDGYFLMWSGDGTANYTVSANDFFNVWLPANGSPGGYVPADFNLDGLVTAFDFIQAWLPSNGRSSQYPWGSANN